MHVAIVFKSKRSLAKRTLFQTLSIFWPRFMAKSPMNRCSAPFAELSEEHICANGFNCYPPKTSTI